MNRRELLFGGLCIPFSKSSPFLSQDDCVRIGGHCWDNNDNAYFISDPMSPLVLPGTHLRVCRHCGRKEIKHTIHEEKWEEMK